MWVRRGVALVALLSILVSWTAMAEVLQDVVSNKYPKPFFVMMMTRVTHAVVLLGTWAVWSRTYRPAPGLEAASFPTGAFTWRQYLKAASLVYLPSFMSGYTWYLSLKHTSVGANTAIVNSSCVLVFLLSACFLRDNVSWLQLVSVVMTVGGVVMVCVFRGSDAEDNATPTLAGYMWCLASGVLYAIYEVGLKKFTMAREDAFPVANSFRMVGLIAVLSLLTLWPMLPVLDVAGVEPFAWPPLDVLKTLGLNAVLDIWLNISIVVLIAASTPVVASVGQVLVVPVTVVCDRILRSYVMPPLAVVGVALIVVGFLICVLPLQRLCERRAQKKKNKSVEGIQ
eukprot:m.48326 g.48326  ORF g.48326 m.48326 type:complete len:340 (+) comp12722_c0_seq1:162-1181(+)